jgi:hypothetical protein
LLDFFKPNTAELERVKTVKKHRHGRRVKQLEKIEQKMKEERQKRIRERQKEFFADIESHRLGDYLGFFISGSFVWRCYLEIFLPNFFQIFVVYICYDLFCQ